MKTREFVLSTVMVVVSSLVALCIGELVLRAKNSAMDNYDIEMWKYARDIKRQSANPVLGHEHVPNSNAVLQSVEIRTNELGLRGESINSADPAQRSILVLGSSIALGWGVPESQTFPAKLETMLREAGKPARVWNGGIGNYNAERYTELFLTHLTKVNPTDIVVLYFLRDAETLERGGGNFLLQHSELAVTLWIAATRLLNKSGEKSLTEHYNSVYDPSTLGFRVMQQSLEKLAGYAHANNIRLYLAMMPDVHNLTNYPFESIHRTMRQIAQKNGFKFVDLLPALSGLNPEKIWAMPGDPHPNALGHELIAKAIFQILN